MYRKWAGLPLEGSVPARAKCAGGAGCSVM